MVKAGCPRYVCKKCGKGREKVYEREFTGKYNKTEAAMQRTRNVVSGGTETVTLGQTEHITNIFKGYADCGCNAGFRAGIVLDPFVERAEPARSRPKRRWTIAA
jgi:hypothetical protein